MTFDQVGILIVGGALVVSLIFHLVILHRAFKDLDK